MKNNKVSFHANDGKVIVQLLFDSKLKGYTVFDSVNIDTFKTDSFDSALSHAVSMWKSAVLSYDALQNELKELEKSKIGIVDTEDKHAN